MYRWQITYTTASADENHGGDVRWAAPRGCVQSVTRLAATNTED